MSRFLETIKLYNGQLQHIDFHNQRLNATRKHFYNTKDNLHLENELSIPPGLLCGITYKCRVLYDLHITSVSFEEYNPQNIEKLYVLKLPNDLDYAFKYADRKFFLDLKSLFTPYEDFIFVREDRITDSSYANLVFKDQHKLYTPAQPLLKGTKRKYYLKQGFIEELDIRIQDIGKFETIFLINAMLDFDWNRGISIRNVLFSHF